MEGNILDSVIEASGAGGGIPKEYSDDEIHHQTTDFLLHFIDQMKELTNDQKARMRAKVIDRALNPQQLMEEVMKPKKVTEPMSSQDFITLLSLIVLIVGFLGFFGYKLYKSIMEQENKKDKKSKKDLKKEKKTTSPPASPRSKKEK